MSEHHHHNHTVASSNDINRSFIIGISLNVIYVIIELWYGWQNNATSLLSDAVHNIGDISGLVLALIAFRLQTIKPFKIFTYGFKKASVVASFVNSVLLAFAIGAIAWEGIQHIINPSPVNGNVVMLVAFIGIIINFSSALLFKKKGEKDLNIKAAYWHLMADALVSLGVVFAGLIMKYTGWYFVDGLTAIIVAVVILFSTWNLFKESFIGVLDGIPSNIDKQKIINHILKVKGVEDIHHMHIWGMSTNENALTCHVLVDKIENIATIKHHIKEELEEHNIKHSTLEFETAEEACEDVNQSK